MNGCHTVVISDVHIGSPFCRHELFLKFLDALRPGTTVVFNGDTIDNPCRPLSEIDQLLVARIEDLANRCTVVWLPGNHDSECRPCNSEAISYHDTYTIANRLLVAHGHQFDVVKAQHRLFIKSFRAFYRVWMLLTRQSMHEAQFAKHWRGSVWGSWESRPPSLSLIRDRFPRNTLSESRYIFDCSGKVSLR